MVFWLVDAFHVVAAQVFTMLQSFVDTRECSALLGLRILPVAELMAGR